jgi:hypothetical protein
LSGVNGLLRVSFVKSVFIWICLGAQALAGHDVMLHLAIYNDGPFKVEKVPAVFGVPLPSSDDPVDLKDLILVGADAFQIRPTSHWPNGSIRWLMVEAIVNVQPSADRAVVHLTKGQRPRELPNIANETNNGFVLKTGNCTVRIEEGKTVLCKVEEVEGESIPDFSIQLSSENEKLGTLLSRKVLLENNGPVTATVAVIEQYKLNDVTLTLSQRCRAFKGQRDFFIESTLRELFSSTPTSGATPALNLTRLLGLNTQPGNSWRVKNSRASTKDLAEYTSGDVSIQLRKAPAKYEIAPEANMNRILLARNWHVVDLAPDGFEPDTFEPHIGVAVSPNTYNDTRCLEAFVTTGENETVLNPDKGPMSRAQASKYLFDMMGGKLLPKPSVTTALNHWIFTSAGLYDPVRDPEDHNEIDEYRFSAVGLYSSWYFLTGDLVLRDSRLDWVSILEPQALFLPHSATLELWDAYLLDGSIERRDLVFANLGNWIDDLRKQKYPPFVGLSTFRLVTNIIHQGGLEGTKLTEWLDRMEWLVHTYRYKYPNDILFAEGYRLTGEIELINQGRRWLKQNVSNVLENNAISGILDNIHRQYTWRWLPIEVEDHLDQEVILKWKVPKGVERYRIKYAEKTITNIPDAVATLDNVAFYMAEDVDLELSLLAAGTEQTVHLSKDQLAGSNFIAMRYLERGPDLPSPPVNQSNALTSEPAENLKKKTDNVSTFIWFFLILIIGGLIFILKKKRT